MFLSNVLTSKCHSISISYLAWAITCTVESGSQKPESLAHCMEREDVFFVGKSVTFLGILVSFEFSF